MDDSAASAIDLTEAVDNVDHSLLLVSRKHQMSQTLTQRLRYSSGPTLSFSAQLSLHCFVHSTVGYEML